MPVSNDLILTKLLYIADRKQNLLITVLSNKLLLWDLMSWFGVVKSQPFREASVRDSDLALFS